MNIGETIRAAREARNWTRQELAYRASIAESTLVKIEGGWQGGIKPLQRICNALDITLTIEPEKAKDTP